jgi:hypothetical protein
MAANYNIIESAQIASNGGNITDERYGAGAVNGDEKIKRGELCYLVAGKLLPVVTTSGTAQEIRSNLAPLDSAKRLFIALEEAEANKAKIKVQEITSDTILEGFIVTSNSDGDVSTPPVTSIGVGYRGYVDANGRFGVQKNTTDNPVFVIEDVDTQYQPYRHADAQGFDEDAGGVRHGRVKFRIASDRILR